MAKQDDLLDLETGSNSDDEMSKASIETRQIKYSLSDFELSGFILWVTMCALTFQLSFENTSFDDTSPLRDFQNFQKRSESILYPIFNINFTGLLLRTNVFNWLPLWQLILSSFLFSFILRLIWAEYRTIVKLTASFLSLIPILVWFLWVEARLIDKVIHNETLSYCEMHPFEMDCVKELLTQPYNLIDYPPIVNFLAIFLILILLILFSFDFSRIGESLQMITSILFLFFSTVATLLFYFVLTLGGMFYLITVGMIHIENARYLWTLQAFALCLATCYRFNFVYLAIVHKS